MGLLERLITIVCYWKNWAPICMPSFMEVTLDVLNTTAGVRGKQTNTVPYLVLPEAGSSK